VSDASLSLDGISIEWKADLIYERGPGPKLPEGLSPESYGIAAMLPSTDLLPPKGHVIGGWITVSVDGEIIGGDFYVHQGQDQLAALEEHLRREGRLEVWDRIKAEIDNAERAKKPRPAPPVW
jgi:hypothetical protein